MSAEAGWDDSTGWEDQDLDQDLDEDLQAAQAGPSPRDGALGADALRAAMAHAVDRAVRDRLEQLAADAIDEALTDDVLSDLVGAAQESAAAAIAPEHAALYYDSLPEFVEDFVAPVYARSFEGRERTWCPAWWNHTEAVARLDAIWRAWEQLRKDPALGPSVWFRDHGDHHMGVLMASDGPFKGCSPTKGHNERDWRRLPLLPPPAGLYDDP